MTFTHSWPILLAQLLEGVDLSVAQAEWGMAQIMRGEASEGQIGAFLVALAQKGESVDEIVGFRDAILGNAEPIQLSANALDIVGTGGDRHGTVNVSTMAALVIAASGVPVVKHGNRAATSQSGSSDVLGALGINIEMSAKRIEAIFADTGIAFIYAAKFHPGFRHVAAVRREIGIPTVFNMLGPLCNPVRPIASAVGVAEHARAELIASVFAIRGATALVFRGDDGLDELTTTGHSRIWEVTQGGISEHDLDPAELGIKRATIERLVGGDAAHNANIARKTLSGEVGPVRDIVLLNAAAGLVAYELAQDAQTAEISIRERLAAKLETASNAIDSGAASALLAQWVDLSQQS
jgi:anthranilate phosphoribosyltransferase